jgi:ribosome recycling factor
MSFELNSFNTAAQKILDHIQQDISSLRTGRASVQLLDPVTVEAYGSRMKLVELATISAPDASMLVVSPWDKSLLEAIARGITVADLQVNPVVDGTMIRISIPPLTEEKRVEMVKRLHQKIEAGKVMFRNLRTETKKSLEDQEGDAGISEDDIKEDLIEMEQVLKTYLEKLEELSSQKEKELMTV